MPKYLYSLFVASIILVAIPAQAASKKVASVNGFEFYNVSDAPQGLNSQQLVASPLVKALIPFDLSVDIPGFPKKKMRLYYNLHKGGKSRSGGQILTGLLGGRKIISYPAVNVDSTDNRRLIIANELYSAALGILVVSKGIDLPALMTMKRNFRFAWHGKQFGYPHLSEYISNYGSAKVLGNIEHPDIVKEHRRIERSFKDRSANDGYALINFVHVHVCKREMQCFMDQADSILESFLAVAPKLKR